MEFDVIVVGASTAGLYASQLLKEAGLHVAVFEREAEHHPARRTLIVTPAFGKVLNSGIPEKVELHRSGLMRVTARRRSCDVRFRRPDPIIERGKVTRSLSASAVEAGVQIFYGYRFLGFEGEMVRFKKLRTKQSETAAGSVDLHTWSGSPSSASSEWVEALDSGVGLSGEETVLVRALKAVVGADGVLTDVGPAAGIKRPPCVPILQAEIDLPTGWDPDVTQVWFDVDDTPYFYWLIPESARRGVVGLIGEPKARMRMLLDSFMAERGLQALAYQGSQVAMHHPRLRPWGRVGKLPVLLVGDAAGQVKVTTVGGSVTGFAGTHAAVRSILRGTSYRRELKPLKRELDLHWLIRRALERLDNRGYAELVSLLDGPVQGFLGKHNRDEMASVFWKLPLIQPRLLKIAVKCLVGSSR